jgi:hypothetical protein
MVQHTQISKCIKAHKQNRAQKSPDYPNRGRNSLRQNSAPTHDKSLKKVAIEGMYWKNPRWWFG